MKQYLELMRDVVEGIERAKSQRNYKSSRLALAKALLSLELADSFVDTNNNENTLLRNKINQAFASIKTKLALPSNPTSKNPATFILLRNKLKPTDDGKDAFIDDEATKKISSFFINFWDPIYVQSQNRTLI